MNSTQMRTGAFSPSQYSQKPVDSLADVVLIFLIGCVIGYVVETLYCIATLKRVESRKGMVYGPLNQVYGLGAVIMTMVLIPLANKGPVVLFVGSALLGGAFEALCSYVQEQVFGTVSWEYSGEAFSFFGGRTNLKFMIFWGFLGAGYIYFLHPVLFSIVDLVPITIKGGLAFAIGAFLLGDLLLSALAVGRWINRVQNVERDGRLDLWLDKHFPDERMADIYPNMVMADRTGATPVNDHA